MKAAIRNAVRKRAHNWCEYCMLSQDWSPFDRFQIEHIISRQHGGTDDLENLALACSFCNSRKGSNLSVIDTETGDLVRFYNP